MSALPTLCPNCGAGLPLAAGPFGIREKATRRTGVAVAKNRMVAVEVTGLAHLLDLADGREITVFPYKGLGATPPAGFDWLRDAAGDARDGVGIATPKGDVGTVVVGLDAKTKATRWQNGGAALFGRDVDRADILEGGDGHAFLGIADGLAAIDAARGTLAWSVTPTSNAGAFNVTLTTSRLCVVTGEWPALPVDVYDVSSGKLLARLGHGRAD